MKTIYTNNSDLTLNKKASYLSADVAAAATTLTVDSIVGYAVNKILLIGESGNEPTEIIKTHASTSPTGSTVTLASALTFAHLQGTKVYIIDWDQVEISWCATVGGTKTVLDTIAIQADQVETLYEDTSKSSGYYFTRFKNTIPTATYSAYSDPHPYADWTSNQVGAVIEYALKRNKLNTFTDEIDHQFCINEINSCLSYVHGKKKKWHRLQQFDYVLGYTSDSEWAFAVPSDMWGYSNKSVLDIHLEGQESLIYKDEREWNKMLENVVYDTLSAAASASDTEIYLTSSYSLESTGTVLCRGDDIDFSANDTSTGELTVTALDNDLADGSMVWDGSYETGLPQYYTVKEGYVLIWPFPDSSYDNIDVMIDYWKEIPLIDSDADTLDISRFDMVKYWLTAMVRAEKDNDGIRTDNDGDYILFERILRDAIRIDLQSSGQKYKMKPKINKISY